jgi:hypothetical protein
MLKLRTFYEQLNFKTSLIEVCEDKKALQEIQRDVRG